MNKELISVARFGVKAGSQFNKLIRSPRVRKGAIVSVDLFNPLTSVVIFQYNPTTLSRTLTPQMSDQDGARSAVFGVKGPPQEEIKVTVEIDATDQLAREDWKATYVGIYPQLSALEMIVYPKTLSVQINSDLAKKGILQVAPPQLSLTLFVWGLKRVLPVRLTSFSIEEEAHDKDLNPIRAKVNLTMRVLTYDDLPPQNPGSYVYLTNQVFKEAMAQIGSVSNMVGVGQDLAGVVQDLIT